MIVRRKVNNKMNSKVNNKNLSLNKSKNQKDDKILKKDCFAFVGTRKNGDVSCVALEDDMVSNCLNCKFYKSKTKIQEERRALGWIK